MKTIFDMYEHHCVPDRRREKSTLGNLFVCVIVLMQKSTFCSYTQLDALNQYHLFQQKNFRCK